MKKTSAELMKELEATQQELDRLRSHNPQYYIYDTSLRRLELPEGLYEKYNYLYARIANLRTNINQAKQREFGVDARAHRNNT